MRSLGRRRWLFTTVLSVALAAPMTEAQAQTGKLTGTVTDAETGKPIQGVNVIIQGTTLGTTTAANGRYFIIQVPPGAYTVQARRIGYTSVNATNAVLTIDQTTEQNFKLRASSTTLAAVSVQADQAPLVPRGQVSAAINISADKILSLPVTSIAEVLALQQGFINVPNNTSLISVAEEQRGSAPAPRIRGGRGGSTLSLIDGIPINNPLFGNPTITLSPFSVSGISFNRGYLDPQYGNATSGAINQSVREGGSEVAGGLAYQNSSLPGRVFGNVQDELLNNNLIQGFLSGPVPGTRAKLRYSVSGDLTSQAGNPLRFDDDIFTANAQRQFNDDLQPDPRDLSGGFQAPGGLQSSNFVANLTFLPLANTTIKLTGATSDRSQVPFDRRLGFLFRGDPLALVNNRADSLRILQDPNNRLSRDLVQAVGRTNGRLLLASVAQRFGRTNVQLRLAQNSSERTTCPIFLGACNPSPFFRPNFAQGFLSPSPGVGGGDRIPDAGGVSLRFGGEEVTTQFGRIDVQSQVTDHNNLQFGAQFTRHDLDIRETNGFGTNSGIQPATTNAFNAQPIEGAAYVQSTIEYDFIKINLGARFEYGRARGQGFTDPFNPTNGTSAREVCADGLAVRGQSLLNAQGQPLGLAGCNSGAINPLTQRSFLFDSAVAVAQRDDFTDASARTAFSPRVGISFPLTERSQIFFNAGRYTQIPLYQNVFNNTGNGVVAGATNGICGARQVRPGTNECAPNLSTLNPEFVGNPNLLLEESKSYEVGYSSQLGRDYSVQVNIFNRSETGLSGLRPGRATQDIGSTFDGSLPQFNVIVNGDFLTARGLEIQFQRRLSNRWGYDISYGISRSTSNARPIERANEIARTDEANRVQLLETVSDINIPHNFLSSIFLQLRDDVAPGPLGIGRLLRNSRASLTYTFRSGVPFTPIFAATFAGIQNNLNAADVNSGNQPSTQQANLQATKNFRLANVAYSAFLRVDNLLDQTNCNQVFANTGTCDAGLRDFNNRRVGNTGDATTSTAFDQPEFIGQRRSFNAGISVNF